MLKNAEIELLENILNIITDEQQALALKNIIDKNKAAHKRNSVNANKWNKDNAKKHNEHNKTYIKNKRTLFNIIMISDGHKSILIDKQSNQYDWQPLNQSNMNKGKAYTENRAKQIINTLTKRVEDKKNNAECYSYELNEVKLS